MLLTWTSLIRQALSRRPWRAIRTRRRRLDFRPFRIGAEVLEVRQLLSAAVTGVSPNQATTQGGTSVQIAGSGFTSVTGVMFGNVAAQSYSVMSASMIMATAPGHAAGLVDIVVDSMSGNSPINSADQFTYQQQSGPQVTSVSPNSGPTSGGSTVTITGSGYSQVSAVMFGSSHATFSVNSTTSITANVPSSMMAGSVDVIVMTSTGSSAANSGDLYTYSASTSIPTVTSLSTSTGTSSGGTSVTITGTNFTNVSGVKFGAVAAQSFTLNSPTSITAITPAETAGTVDVKVTNSAGTSSTSSADQFTFQSSAPVVSSLSTSTGSTAGGTSVTISGSNFSAATAVSFGGIAAASFTINGPGSIVAVAPAHAAGVVDVQVTTSGGTSAASPSDQFTFQSPAPVVSSLSASTGSTAGGTSVTISGSNFSAATAVSFGGIAAASFTVNGSGSIVAVAPAHAAGVVDVQVTTSGGTSATSPSDQFTFQSPAPVVSSLSASTGSTSGGTSVTISGSNFSGATAVSFGGVTAASFTVNGSGSIVAVAPAHAAGVVDVQVTTSGGTSATSPSDQFTFQTPAPVVSSLSVSTGPAAGGTSVTISGSNLSGATAVSFGGVAATSFTVNGSGMILAVAPAHAAGVVDVQVTTSGGTSAVSQSDQFTFQSPAPVVSSLSASTGSTDGGTSVTIFGSNLSGATGVSFGGVAAASFTIGGSGSIVAIAPAHTAGQVDVTVTTPGGTSAVSPSDQFTFQSSTPVVSSLSTSTGSTAGGTSIAISGSNFSGATAVSFGTVAAASFTVNGSGMIVAVAPAHAAGQVDVTVTTPSGTSAVSASDQFTFQVPAPVVSSLDVSTGSTAGGTSVTISGTNLSGATAVSFGNVAAASFTVNGSGSIVAVAPAHAAGQVDVTVTTPGGTSAVSSSDQFTFQVPAPVVSSLSVSTGPTAGGTSVTISGSNFTGATAVSFGGIAAASFTVSNSGSIVAVTPIHTAAQVDVRVTAPNGRSAVSSSDLFTFTASTSSGGPTASQAASNQQTAQANADAAFQTASDSATTDRQNAENNADATHTAAVTAAQTTLANAIANADSTNASAVTAANNALNSALGTFASSFANVSFSGFSWPDAPPDLPVNLQGDEPTVEPQWSGPAYDPNADPGFQSALSALSATQSAATAQADATMQQSFSDAANTYNSAAQAAANDKQSKLNQANQVYQQAIDAPNPFKDDLTKAQNDYTTNRQAAQKARDDALQAASNTYQSAANAAYQAFLAANPTTPPEYYAAWCTETQAVSDAATVYTKAAEAINNQYGHTLRELEVTLANVNAQYSNWSQNNSNQANLQSAESQAQIEEEYQFALDEAQDVRSRSEAHATEIHSVAVAQIEAQFESGVAMARAESVSAWAALTGTAWANYQSAVAQHQAAHDESVAAATEAQSTAIANEAETNDDARADAVQVKADAYAKAQFDHDENTPALAADEASTRIDQGESLREADTNAALTRDEAIAAAHQVFVDAMADAQNTETKASASAWCTYETATYNISQSYFNGGMSSDDYSQQMADAWKTYRHTSGDIWYAFATASLNAQGAYEDATEDANQAYLKASSQAYGDFQTATNDAALIHIASSALADADLADAKSAADKTYAVTVADAGLQFANSAADDDYNLAVAQAGADSELSIAMVGDHQTFANQVMAQYVGAISNWSSSVAATTPEWGQYFVHVALADQSRTAAVESAQVAFATEQALATQNQAIGVAEATRTWDTSSAQQDHDYAVSVADAARTQGATKNYAMFDAVTDVAGESYRPMTVDFARDFVAAYSPSQASSDPTASLQQQQKGNDLNAAFEDAIEPAADTEQRALLSASHDLAEDTIDWAGYEAQVQAAYDAYQKAYLAALAAYRKGQVAMNLAPSAGATAPIPVPPVLSQSEQIKLAAADRIINADRDYRFSVAAANQSNDLNAASAQEADDATSILLDENFALDRAAAQKTLDITLAQDQATYDQAAAAAQGQFDVDGWTRIRNESQAAALANPTPLNVYDAAFAQSQLDELSAEAAGNAAMTSQTTALDVQNASTLAELTRERDVALATAQATNDQAVAAASYDNSTALANAQYAREAGSQGAGGDAGDEADYRKQVAFDNIEYDHLTTAALDRYQAEVAAARAAEALQGIDASYNYDSGNTTSGQYTDATNSAADTRAASVDQARIEYVQDAGGFYVRHITALSKDDVTFATNLAGNEYNNAIDTQAADDAYNAAARTAGADERVADALANSSFTIGEALANQALVAGKQAAAVAYNSGLVTARLNAAGDLAQAEADYHVGVVQQALATTTDSFQAGVLSLEVGWLQGLAPQYVSLARTVAQADAAFDLASAQIEQTYQNTQQAAEVTAATIGANADEAQTVGAGAATDALDAATDAASSTLNVNIAALNQTALVESANARADHAVNVAEAHRDYDVAVAKLPRDSSYDQAFYDAQQNLADELRGNIADADVTQATALGDAAVEWVSGATDFAVAYTQAYASALETRAGSLAAVLSTQATTVANADYNLALASTNATANQWVSTAQASATRDNSQAVARSGFYLAQEQANATSAATFIGHFRQAASVTSLALLNNTSGSASDPTVTGTVNLGGLPNFALVEFNFDGSGTVQGTTYTDLSGHFTFTPPASALANGPVTIRARTDLGGTTSAWNSLSFTFVADTVHPPISAFTVQNLNQGASASSVLTGAIGGTGSLAGVTIQFDVTGNGTVAGQTTTDSSGHFSFTASGLPEGYTVVAARVAGGQWVRLGFVHTSNPGAPQAIQGWGDFEIASAAARYAAAQLTATAWNTMAAEEGQAQVDYASQVAADYLTQATATASADRADNLAVAAATAGEIVDAGAADADYMTQLAPAEKEYRIAVAQIERQYRIDVADASRDPNTSWQAISEANDRYSNDLQLATEAFTTTEGTLAMAKAERLGTDMNTAASSIAAAALSRATITSTAAQKFADAQAQDQDNLQLDLAARERDFAMLSASQLQSKMDGLAANSPSPFATREAALADAEEARAQAVSDAQYAASATQDAADLAFAESSDQAEATFAEALASAEATDYVATVGINVSYLEDLALVRESLIASGAYDPPLIFPIDDAPPLMGDGQAFAHIGEDGALAVSSWSAPYTGTGAYWVDGLAYYGIYSDWAVFDYYGLMGYGYLGAGYYGYYGYYGGYIGYFGYADYGLYGGYYGGLYGLYGYGYDGYGGYIGMYSDYGAGYGWLNGYGSAGWSGSTYVGEITSSVLNDLLPSVSGLNPDGGAYGVSTSNPVDGYMATLPQPPAPPLPQGAGDVVDAVVNQAAEQTQQTAAGSSNGTANAALMQQLQAENAHLEKLNKMFDAAETTLLATKGFSIGVLKGFFKDGLWGSATDLYTIGEAIVTAPWKLGGFIGDTVGSWWSGNWEGSQAQEVGRTAQAVVSKVKEIGNDLMKFVENNPRLAKDLLFAAVVPGGAVGAAIDAGLSDEGQALLLVARQRVQTIYSAMADKISSLPVDQQAEILGRITGYVLYQVAETYVTAGIGKAVTAAAKSGKVSAALYKIQKIVDAIPGFKWVDEGGVVTRALASLADDVAFLFKTRICFVAGTPIHTLEGLKNIEAIGPGDLVLTRAEADGTTRTAPVYKPVLQTFVTHPDALYHVTLTTDAGETETLSTTAGHPFYVLGKSAFVEAQDLNAGDKLALPEGQSAIVTAVRIERAAPGKSFTTYNFAVADTHTYFAGRQGVWVHNLGDNPCKILAAGYLDDIARGATPDQALAKMASKADEMLAAKELADQAARDKHLADAIKELGFPDGTPIPGAGVPRSIGRSSLFDGVRGKNLASLTNKEIGDLGEQVAQKFLKENGYTDIIAIQNNSGNGIDIVAKGRDGRLSFFEVKTSSVGIVGDLSTRQADMGKFVKQVLEDAANRTGRYRKISSQTQQWAEGALDAFRRDPLSISGEAIGVDLLNETLRVSPWK